MSLSSAVCSITVTKRGRFFWAAWWTGEPTEAPFRKPDAANGGAHSEAEALAEAERVAGRHLTRIAPYWARAFTRILRGEPAPPRRDPSQTRKQPPQAGSEPSAYTILGLAHGANALDVRAAYRRRALETHPDQGGSDEAFRAVQTAYERLTKRKRRR